MSKMKIPLEKQGLERSMMRGGAEATGICTSYKMSVKGCAEESMSLGSNLGEWRQTDGTQLYSKGKAAALNWQKSMAPT